MLDFSKEQHGDEIFCSLSTGMPKSMFVLGSVITGFVVVGLILFCFLFEHLGQDVRVFLFVFLFTFFVLGSEILHFSIVKPLKIFRFSFNPQRVRIYRDSVLKNMAGLASSEEIEKKYGWKTAVSGRDFIVHETHDILLRDITQITVRWSYQLNHFGYTSKKNPLLTTQDKMFIVKAFDRWLESDVDFIFLREEFLKYQVDIETKDSVYPIGKQMSLKSARELVKFVGSELGATLTSFPKSKLYKEAYGVSFL